jgi:hypothetical protein
LPLAVGLWVAAFAVGITTGTLTDSPPTSPDAERSETVAGEPEDPLATPVTTAPPPAQPPTTIQPPTSLPPTTTTPPPPEDSEESEEDEDTDTTRCDAAQAAAQQAQAAVDHARETLIDLAEVEQTATDAETNAEEACSDDDD